MPPRNTLLNPLFFKARAGNFGDDLNPYVFDYLRGKFGSQIPDRDGTSCVLGIGSILNESNFARLEVNKYNRIHVFGSGCREFADKRSLFRDLPIASAFVRGPLSGLVTGFEFISDAGYLAGRLLRASGETGSKHGRTGVMPHFSSIPLCDWSALAQRSGLEFIDPTSHDTIETAKKIAACDRLFTEAMHGAIVADSLGVPWARFKLSSHLYESGSTAEFKWNDWLMTIGKKSESIELGHAHALSMLGKRAPFRFFLRYIRKSLVNTVLYHASRVSYVKSSASEVERICNLLENQYLGIARIG